MRKLLYAFWVGTFAAVMSIPIFAGSAGAQTTVAEAVMSSRGVIIEAGGASDADLDFERYRAWDEFQSSYPSVAAQLRHNSRLAGSSEFVTDLHACGGRDRLLGYHLFGANGRCKAQLSHSA